MEYCSQFILLSILLVREMADGVPTQSRQLARAARSTSACQNPPNLDSLLRQANGVTDGVAYVRNANWTGLETTSSTSVRCDVGNNNDDDDGNVNANQQPSAPARVLCPWTYDVLSLPDDYYPRTVLQAKCMCMRCAAGHDKNNCERVTANIRVLRKSEPCVAGYYSYAVTTIRVTVGCACVAPTTDRSENEDVEYLE